MLKSNRYSGAQNRKRKAKQEKKNAIQKDSLLQFMKTEGNGKETDGTASQTAMQEPISSRDNKDNIVIDMHEFHDDDDGNGVSNDNDDVGIESEAIPPPTETELSGVYNNSFHQEPVQVGVSFTDENQSAINFDDPALWPKNSDSSRIFLITKGPVQVKQNLFPETMNRR